MRRLPGIAPLQALAAVGVFVSPALWEFVRGSSLSSLTAADFWWHLQTGLEILRTHSLPHTGWFSQSAAQPWIASAWLYDVLAAIGFRWLDLRFLPLLAALAKLALAFAVFVLAGGMRGRPWTALGLSLIAQYLLWQMPPLPIFCSVLALAIELVLLFDYRQAGRARSLYFLPLLFLAWANLDFHFVYGVVALALFTVGEFIGQHNELQIPRSARDDKEEEERVSQQGSLSEQLKLRPFKTRATALLIITAVCVIAGCATPYGWASYGVLWTNATSAANAYFPDYLSLRFRSSQDYVLMLLAMVAFLSLGLRRSRDVFQIALLVLCTVAAFHAQRDGWLLVLAATAVIADATPEEASSGELCAASSVRRTTIRIATAVSFVLLLAFAAARMPSRDAMVARVAEHYPLAAADYIRANRLPAPLFNPYPWGGFLAWYLPEYPVAIDGRAELYGPDFNIEYAKAMNFEAHYSTFAPLDRAATILLEKNSNMAAALPSAPGFKTVYSDNVAVILVRDQY